jgi:hypothetical protein
MRANHASSWQNSGRDFSPTEVPHPLHRFSTRATHIIDTCFPATQLGLAGIFLANFEQDLSSKIIASFEMEDIDPPRDPQSSGARPAFPVNPSRRSRRPKYNARDWEARKARLKELWVVEDRTLSEVMDILKRDNFHAECVLSACACSALY